MKCISISTLSLPVISLWLAAASAAWAAPTPVREATKLKDLSLLPKAACDSADQSQCKVHEPASDRPAIMLAWGNVDCSNTNISVSYLANGTVDRPMLTPPYPCAYLRQPGYYDNAVNAPVNAPYPIPPQAGSAYNQRRSFGYEEEPSVGSQCANFHGKASACSRVRGCTWNSYRHQCVPSGR